MQQKYGRTSTISFTILLWLATMSINLTALCQSSFSKAGNTDSTFSLDPTPPAKVVLVQDTNRMYQIAIWKMWELVHMAQRALTADSTITYLIAENASSDRLIMRSKKIISDCDSTMAAKNIRIETSEGEKTALRREAGIQKEYADMQKTEKKKWRTAFWGMVVLQVAEIVLVVLLF